MKRIVYLLILMSLASQARFSLTGVNSDEFPKIKMGFTATDVNNNPIDNILSTDFTIVENGVDLSASVEVSCENATDVQEASILLVLDQSVSMRPSLEDPTDRWEWLTEGVTAFLESIEFSGRTQVAITKFGKKTQLLQYFTTDRELLIKQVEETDPQGTATFYNPPFLDPEVGAVKLLSETPIDMKRVVVFLTDGINTANEEDKYNEIISDLNANGINAYTISLLMNIGPDLARVAGETGGRSFEVFTRENLSEIYSLIALDIQKVQVCNLTYTSPFACDETAREREVIVTYENDPDNVPDTRNYFAPDNSVARFEISNTNVNFGNPDENTSSNASTTINVLTAPLKVDNIIISPNTFFEVNEILIDGVIANYGDEVQPGSELVLNMQFNQGANKEFRQAGLEIIGDWCGPKIDLVGGFSQVVLINPKDGITSSSCDEIEIQWAGVDEQTQVRLFYQEDGNANWIPINGGNLVSGGSFNWFPPDGGNYKIRVERPEENLFLWNSQISSVGNAITSGLVVSDDGSSVYNSGYYEEDLIIKGNSYNSLRNHDIFVTKYDRDGNVVWNTTHIGTGDDSTSGIAKLPNGNIVVCGTVDKGIDFGSVTPFIQFDDVSYAFIALYDTDTGEPLSVRVYGARGINQSTEAWGMGVRYDDASGFIQFVGRYAGPMEVVYPPNSETLPSNQNNDPRPFIIFLDTDLNTVNADNQGYTLSQFERFSGTDANNNIYSTGYFEESNNPFGYTSDGKFDSYIAKFGTIEASQDENIESFEVEKPVLIFNQAVADIGDVMLSESNTRSFAGILTNPGDLAVELESTDFTLNYPNEFSLGTTLPERIPGGESRLIEFSFTPQELGPRSGTFNLKGECADVVSVELIGNGTCRGEALPTFDVGAGVTSLMKPVQANAIFTNPTNQSIQIEPIIINDPTNQFEVFIIDNGTLINSINVAPFASVDLEIQFTPSTAGIHNATIDYQVVDVCENVLTELTGEGIESSVLGATEPTVNRVFTLNNGIITLENLSPLDVTIDDLSLITNTDNAFQLLNILDEYVVAGNSTLEINYTFNPQTEGQFTSTLRIETSDGNVNESTLLRGTGLRPDLDITLNCPAQATIQGEQGNATLVVTNTSTLENVLDIDISSLTNEYKFTSNLDDLPTFDLAPEESRNINVVYSPINPNPTDADFEITANAALGNNNDATYEDSKSFDDSFVGCSVEPSLNVANIDFGNILICDKPGRATVEITNTSSADLVISPSDFQLANDEGVFIVDVPANQIVITPNSQPVQIEVTFIPIESINYNDVLTVNNNQGRLIQFNLIGIGTEIQLDAEVENNNIKPDSNTQFDKIFVSAEIPELANGDANWSIENLTIRLDYNQNVIDVLEDAIDLTGQGITWEIDYGVGYIDIIAQNQIVTPMNGRLFELVYTVYLSNELESDIKYSVYYENCETPDFNPLQINIQEFCVAKYRLIATDISPFSIKGPNPNPIGSSAVIDFSVPYEGQTKIEIYDMLGNLVAVPYNEYITQGSHNIILETNDIPSGVYYLKLSTVLNSETKQILISK